MDLPLVQCFSLQKAKQTYLTENIEDAFKRFKIKSHSRNLDRPPESLLQGMEGQLTGQASKELGWRKSI